VVDYCIRVDRETRSPCPWSAKNVGVQKWKQTRNISDDDSFGGLRVKRHFCEANNICILASEVFQ